MAFSDAEGNSSVIKGGRKRKRSEATLRPSLTKWRTQGEQSSYSTKLYEALRRVHRSSPSTAVNRRSQNVREAADRALAVAARGRTRWSRAILISHKPKLKLKARRPRPAVPSSKRSKMLAFVQGEHSASKKTKKSTILEDKAVVLGRLVPGGRKLSFPTLLEEASDYIAALQMQVRAMSVLSAILSSSTSNESFHQEPDRINF
ncbi:hypothetical protein HPP92_001079 [Vanilla planifolia]|uniref:IBH1-like N-terminal domain-containing protein n=1 Tax=Vanilla planifolia TaxID=51239 RepID=A0A835VJC2_VANPL|nr:hypothetical protein HPP92_001231 [Vanilla planifolia]KAG0501007.1 hypothetical protein HPP92_001079 [Vanilla planifolia]